MRSLASVALLFLSATALPAQQQTQQTPPRDARQTTIERLRTMGQERPDTSALPDSVRERLRRERADSVARRTPRPVAPVALERDSLMLALAQLPGFTITEYKGMRAHFNADTGVLVLNARPDTQAVVLQGMQTMTADSLLTYDRGTAIACGFGKPVLTGEGAEAPVQSTQVCYNTKTRIGSALGASTRVSEGANWIVYGDLTTADTDLYIDHGRFTDCTLDVPHYHFSAAEVKVVNKDVMVARNVTLTFGDVPVFWLPFLMQSLKQGRRSGILMPEFSVNDIVRRSSGYNRRISNLGFYWAASEYVGAQLAFGWFDENWKELNGRFDLRIAEKFLNTTVDWRQYWPAEGGKQNTVSVATGWQPDERTSLAGNVGYASSSRFYKQNTFDPRELNQAITSNANLNRRFDWASVSLSGSRQQHLQNNQVNMTLPSLGVTFSAVTLFPATGTTRWYNNASWTGDVQSSLATVRSDQFLVPTSFDTDQVTASARSTFSMGRFSLSQGFQVNRGKQLERTEGIGETGDTIRYAPQVLTQRMEWNTSLNFMQRLIGTSTFTPSLALRGESARDTATGVTVAGPTRLVSSATLKLDLYGFWPGVGPVERIRHHMSPSFTYSYSPASITDSIQTRVFGRAQVGEQNQLSIGLTQTIEGKYRSRSTAADSAAAPDTTSSSMDPDQPRRLPQAPRVRLLSLSTNAVVYDFVQAREGYGIQTTQISSSINSDLLRGLQLSMTHDLFRQHPLPEGAPSGTRAARSFAPHLSGVNAAFSLDSNSWLFRWLRLGGGNEAERSGEPPAQPPPAAPAQDTPLPTGGPDLGLLGSRNQTPVPQGPREPVGNWNANLNYSMSRPRAETGAEVNQMVTATLRFQPTASWSVNWNTGYSFTDSRFTDHVLTFTRAMHDWDANFDFVKAQNGNFSFQFRVALRANSDIKFDYRQRDHGRPAGLPQ